jgi:hypothetical protein
MFTDFTYEFQGTIHTIHATQWESASWMTCIFSEMPFSSSLPMLAAETELPDSFQLLPLMVLLSRDAA